MFRRGLCLFVLIAPLLADAAARAQDEPRPADAGSVEMPGPEATPERLREFLRRQSERLAREQKALDEALTMLDAGEPLETVRERLRATIQGQARERIQQFRETRRLRPGLDREPVEPGLPARPLDGPPVVRPVEKLLGVLQETNPQMHERLTRLREQDPAEFQRVLEEFAPRIARMAEERERFPERWPERLRAMRLHQQATSAAREVRLASPEQRPAATARLRQILGEMFDLRVKQARQDLDRHRAQVDRLERDIQAREADRDADIDRHMKQILDDAATPLPGERPPPPPLPPGA